MVPVPRIVSGICRHSIDTFCWKEEGRREEVKAPLMLCWCARICVRVGRRMELSL